MGTGLLEAAIFARRAAEAARRDFNRDGAASAGAAQAHALPLPATPEILERRMDTLMGPLVVLRRRALVEAALTELQAWPTTAGDRLEFKAAFAALRREAALAVLSCGATRAGAAPAIVGAEAGD